MDDRHVHFLTTAVAAAKVAEHLYDIANSMNKLAAMAGDEDEVPEEMLRRMDAMAYVAKHALGIIEPNDLLIFSNN